ncbi:MAG: glutathione S-transferase [Flavobacteriales bacterium]|jgi:glutathione S-transferase
MYKLFYSPRNASWAIHLLLEDLGLDYELVLVDRALNEHKSAEYLALNPTGRIPTLIHDGAALFESCAIALYICENHSELAPIPPLGDSLRPLCYQWLMYIAATLQPEMLVYFYPKKHITNSANAGEVRDAQAVRITEMFNFLDKQVGGNDYLLGNTISICDYFLFMVCHWASEFKRPPIEFTNLRRVLKKLAGRPSFQKVCIIEEVDLTIYQ